MAGERRSVARIFRFPALIALVIAFGLISALLGDGIWDAASWIALGLPVLIVAVFLLRKTA
jgi:hypothetical protein